ncbi:hypothetical protein QFC20_006831 [Naganishia adeliensis]|uniref:Uncharacterized protein n=1 Tax=Naganishia adeliensis TaxID=92952 RepID=A0ACC2V7J2_9TREE|nr:hypothetical protein QFC20_006831 [Naganishia adeliensis]
MPPRKPRASAAATTSASSSKKRARSEENDTVPMEPVTKRGRGRPRKSEAAPAASAGPKQLQVVLNSASTRPTRSLTKTMSSRRRSVVAPNGVLERNMKLSILEIPKPKEKVRPGRTLLVWGCGDSGEFGMGEGDDVKGEINRPKLHAWIQQAIQDGTLGEPGAGVEDVIVGGMHSLMIDETGRLWAWGVNDGGALGRKTDKVPVEPATDPVTYADREMLESTPGLVTGLGPDHDFRVVRAAAGDSISVAISSTGDVKYWGSFRGAEGLLGFGGVKKAIQYEPVDLPFASFHGRSSAFVAVAAGTDHVLALASDGHVYSMGDNVQGQLGRKVPPRAQLRALTPEPLALKRIRAIGTGAYHSFAMDLDGRVWAWGFNAAGQCGVAPERRDRSWAEGIVERPTIVDALLPENHGGARVIKIEAGSDHSLFLFDNGSVWACGKNIEHELGLADDHPALQPEQGSNERPKAVFQPVQVFFPPPPTLEEKQPPVKPYEDTEEYRAASNKVVDISCGTRHNLAITNDDYVYSWGLGVTSQLGLGNKESAETPTLIRTPPSNPVMAEYKPLKVAASAGHCFILAQKKEKTEAKV